MPSTLEDLEAAKARLEHVLDRDSSDTSGNPDKYRTRISAARDDVRRIEQELKESGVIPLTEKELLEQKLDNAFPKARSKEIVDFEGAKYQLKFSPRTMSRSGKSVMEWNRFWVKL